MNRVRQPLKIIELDSKRSSNVNEFHERQVVTQPNTMCLSTIKFTSKAVSQLPMVGFADSAALAVGDDIRDIRTESTDQFSLHPSLPKTESNCDLLGLLLADIALVAFSLENEKALEFTRRTRAFVSEVDGGRTRNLRIDSPVL